jgi:phosphoglycerate dehydrogenase-like enzyme
MSGPNSFKFVLLPPQSETTRDWANRLAEIVPEARVIVAEDADTAAREVVDAEAAFGWLGSDLLLKATKLRWVQAPQAAPPAGYYYPDLIAHSAVVTNFREIFNDHIGAHILAFVLAFARGLHIFIAQQFRREWKKSPTESGDVVHLPEATALIVGVGGTVRRRRVSCRHSALPWWGPTHVGRQRPMELRNCTGRRLSTNCCLAQIS